MPSVSSVAVGNQPDPNTYPSASPKVSKVGPNSQSLVIVSQTMELNLQLTKGEIPGIGTYVDEQA